VPDVTVTSVYQPIADLLDGSLVAVEALVRGPAGPLELPAQLFAAAAAEGTLDRLDEACLRSALDGIGRLDRPATVFVNVEPSTLSRLPACRLADLAEHVQPGLRVVLEITERDLLENPAELVRSVDRVRELGWGLALDDVGAEPAGMALLPFLRPDVIKLDLALIRGRTTRQAASVVNAVRAEAERSGAVVLAEGIETEEHVERALAVGASLGQGWLLGRPGPLDVRGMKAFEVAAAGRRPDEPVPAAGTPYELISALHRPKRAGAPLLAAMTRQLEHQAMLLDEHTVVLAGFQDAALMSEQTRRRYASLAAVTALTAVVGPGMPAEPALGVHGTAAATDDPQNAEWVVVVVGPHFAAVMAAREVGGVPLGGTATASNGIVIVDAASPDLPLVFVNEAFLQLSGREEHEVIGRNCRILQGPGTDRSQAARLQREVAAGRPVSTVILNYRKDGTSFWNELRISPVLDGDGVLTHFIGNQLDVTERVERERRHAHLASHDELTGFANRAGVLAHLDARLRQARRDRTGVAVLLLDLDGFKAVNDRLGHTAGDEVLRSAADRLGAALRSGELMGRLGGDEFLVVLGNLPSRPEDRDTTGPSAADVVGGVEGVLRSSLTLPLRVGETEVQLRASVGTAVFPRDAADGATLLAFADAAMYRDKATDS